MNEYIGVYYRVSTADKQSVENQRVAVAKWLISQGIEPNACKVYEDFVSGITDRRESLQKLISDIKNGEIKKLIVWRLDRLGRSLSHLVKMLELIQKYDVSFVSLKESFDTSTSAGRLMYHIVASMAEFERDLISERVRMSIFRRKAEKLPVGRLKGSRDKRKRKTKGYFEREKRKRAERAAAVSNLVGNESNLKRLKARVKKDQAHETKIESPNLSAKGKDNV